MNSDHSKIYSSKLRRNLETGIALLSVLWMLLLLSALAATSVYVSRTNAILVHRSLELAQAQAAADAAIVDAISKLSDELQLRHSPVDGIARPWTFEGTEVMVSVSNEAGRIDVNAADDDLIIAFLESQNVTHDKSTTLVRDLRAWQGADSVGPHEANSASVYKPGFSNSPSGRSLEAVGELRQIASWNEQNVDCWTDTMTVYSALPGIGVVDAVPGALDALQWAQDHRLGDREWMVQGPTSAGPSRPKSAIGDLLRIDARANTSTGIRATSQWIGRLTGDIRKPMLTMHWSHNEMSCRESPGPVR
jgi:general secretion pathway protein K